MGNSSGSKTFLHSGALGDVIYSLPVLRELGGGVLYLKSENRYHKGIDFFLALYDLLKQQDYISGVQPYPNIDFYEYDPYIHIDYDLDLFRKHPLVLRQNMVQNYRDTFNIVCSGHGAPVQPWLYVTDPRTEFDGYAVINRTARYRTSFDWKKLHAEIVNNYVDKIVFIGTEAEYLDYIREVGFCSWEPTKDLLEVAQIIAACSEVYCNQSVCLTISQAMGEIYTLEVANNHENCYFLTPNETLLNRWIHSKPPMDMSMRPTNTV